ncbi:MAG: permease-like cell division protein FtsX, partial [bacterium]
MSLNIVYTVREAFKGLKRHRFSSLMTMLSITISLIILEGFLVLTFNLKRGVDLFKQRLGVEIFIDSSLSAEETEKLRNRIVELKEVEKAVFVSQQQALEEFKAEFEEDIVKIIGENPLPASIRIELAKSYRTTREVEKLETKLLSFPGVEDVIYHGEIFKIVNRYSRIGMMILMALFLVVLFASILLITNTLRLTILSQKRLISVMQLVGATKSFIQRPYLIQGLFHGLTAGCISSALILFLVELINTFYGDVLIIREWLLLIPIFVGLFMGVLGSYIGVRKFLGQ